MENVNAKKKQKKNFFFFLLSYHHTARSCSCQKLRSVGSVEWTKKQHSLRIEVGVLRVKPKKKNSWFSEPFEKSPQKNPNLQPFQTRFHDTFTVPNKLFSLSISNNNNNFCGYKNEIPLSLTTNTIFVCDDSNKQCEFIYRAREKKKNKQHHHTTKIEQGIEKKIYIKRATIHTLSLNV